MCSTLFFKMVMIDKVYRVNDSKYGIWFCINTKEKKKKMIIYSGTVNAVFQNCISKQGTGGHILNTSINKCNTKVPPPPNANTVQATHMRMHSCTLLHVSQMQSAGNVYQLTTGGANTNKIELNINMLTVCTY